jgi:hypothetical protein
MVLGLRLAERSMDLEAYAKLDVLSLPRPKMYRLEELIRESSPDRFYYLRTQQGANLPQLVSSADLHLKADDFRRLTISREIIQIEEWIPSIVGGCVVTRGSLRYIELAAGHLSGLLLHGWCQIRRCIAENVRHTQFTEQKLMVEQTVKGKRIVPAARIGEDLAGKLITEIERLLAEITSGLLFEFIVDATAAIYFVDIKDYPWPVDFCPAVSDQSAEGILYKDESLYRGDDQIYDGAFELENLRHVNRHTIIRLGSYAVLSHFITYSLRKGVPSIIR